MKLFSEMVFEAISRKINNIEKTQDTVVQWVYAPVKTRKAEGSNLAAVNFLLDQISSRKSVQKKERSLSLMALEQQQSEKK